MSEPSIEMGAGPWEQELQKLDRKVNEPTIAELRRAVEEAKQSLHDGAADWHRVVVEIVPALLDRFEKLEGIEKAATSLNEAWSDAIDAMDDDNQIPPDDWQRWMKAHRHLRSALDAAPREKP